MQFDFPPYTFPLVAAAVVSAIVAVYTWIRRAANGARALFVLAIFVFEWIVSYLLEVMGTGLETKYFFGVLEYVGIAFVPYSWLIFSIAYSGQERILSRRFLVLTALIPSITVLLAWTTRWHGLVWSEYHQASQGNFSALEVSHGPWFFVHLAYSYIILLIGAYFLVRMLFRRKGMYRGQIIAMLLAVLAPWIGNILYLTKNSPIPYLDLTPFAFTVSVAAVAWAIFGFRLVDITPLARDLVVDSMREGMVVLDARGYVVDINTAAARMIGVVIADALGRTAADIFHPWPHLVERFRNVTEALDVISVGTGATERSFEVRLSSLNDLQGQFVGRVILLRALGAENDPQTRPVRPGPTTEPPAPDRESPSRKPFWNAVIDYYRIPLKKDLVIPENTSPTWYQTRERLFTVILRLAGTVGILGLLFTGPNLLQQAVTPFVLFLAILVLLWVLGLVRNVKYEIRVSAFLFLVYCLAFVELLNFGFSVESFTFFMTFGVVSAVLTARRGALHGLVVSVATLGVFAVLIGSKTFTPFVDSAGGFVTPPNIQAGLSSLLAFTACAAAVLASVVILLENLNNAWHQETQAHNLLQQERDLLEQRVEERTRDLAEARDQAIIISRQMRKYYRAIEQSGNTIVITDRNGLIEYANPQFEKSSGYTAVEAIGSNQRMLKSGRQPPEYYENLWKTISSGRVWNGEFLNKRKDGTLYWESATIAPVQDQNGVITNYVAIKEDITARRQVEEQLQKLSQAVEQSGNTVIIMDRNGLIEYVNPKFTQVTGYTPQDAIGQSPISLMNGLERTPDFSRDEWWLTVNTGQIWRGEFRNHRKDGSVFWESATIAPVQNSSGEIINFVEIKQDITEQKILQEQIQKQNDYLSILHQIALDLLNRRDLNDLLQVIVDRSAILLDAPFSELMLEQDGVLVVEAFTTNQSNLKGDRVTRSQAKLSWQAFDTHQPVVLENYSTWEHRRDVYSVMLHAVADFPVMAGERCLGILALGRSTPGYGFTPEQVETGILFARLVALVLDNASLIDSAMREISERKRTEVLLLESEVRFRQIVENASDIIYRADANGRFTYANPAAWKLLGFGSEEEALGRHYLDMTTPDFRQRLKRVYDRQYVSKTRNTYFEFPAVTMQGEVLWIGQNVQLIMENGQVTGFQAVARDITQLKQAQEALAISRDQALDASRFKSQLLSRVSHELRTPLGGILGYAELLEYQAFGPLTEKQLDAVTNIIESTNFLTGLVNDLLDEAQIEANSLTLDNEYFDPAELVEKTKAAMSVLAAKKGLACRSAISPELPSELYGDVNRLQQVIINLVGNAIKFTQQGEVSLSLNRPSPAFWSIEVRDTGVGIPAHEQQTIFEPFRQVSNSITRENRGSGLGLAITRQLVELMGGRIQLESKVEEGSLFIVTLPILNAPGE
ncbi:MAG: PAS domain S-box protein [Chloroflexota bacterium]